MGDHEKAAGRHGIHEPGDDAVRVVLFADVVEDGDNDDRDGLI
jgi:hypothetical protein